MADVNLLYHKAERVTTVWMLSARPDQSNNLKDNEKNLHQVIKNTAKVLSFGSDFIIWM